MSYEDGKLGRDVNEGLGVTLKILENSVGAARPREKEMHHPKNIANVAIIFTVS